MQDRKAQDNGSTREEREECESEQEREKERERKIGGGGLFPAGYIFAAADDEIQARMGCDYEHILCLYQVPWPRSSKAQRHARLTRHNVEDVVERGKIGSFPLIYQPMEHFEHILNCFFFVQNLAINFSLLLVPHFFISNYSDRYIEYW